MFRKAIEAIIQDGQKRLQELRASVQSASEAAKAEVEKRQREVEVLVDLSKNVPENVFGRFSNIMIGEFNVDPQDQASFGSASLDINHMTSCSLSGISGSATYPPGRYRAVVLLERIGDVRR